MDAFRQLLNEKIKGLATEQLTLVKVKDVNEEKLTCTCILVSADIEVYDVLLTPVVNQEASEITVIPEIGTLALMAIVSNDIRNCYLLSCQKSSKVIMRGGNYGGLVKVNELRDNLNKTTDLLKALVNVINGTPIPEPGSGSPSALQTALKTAIASYMLGTFDDIENNKILHG